MTGARFRKTAANVNPTNTRPIAEKTMILRRFLFFGLAIRSPSRTRIVSVLLHQAGPTAEEHDPCGLTRAITSSFKDWSSLPHLPQPGSVKARTKVPQIPKSQAAALPKETRLNLANP